MPFMQREKSRGSHRERRCYVLFKKKEVNKDFADVKKEIEKFLEEYWGPRCKTKDYEDFPELDPINVVGDPEAGRCPACLVYEKLDNFIEYASSGENDL